MSGAGLCVVSCCATQLYVQDQGHISKELKDFLARVLDKVWGGEDMDKIK